MSLYDKASLVLIPSGTKTGTVFSQKPVPSNDVLGDELVTNGTFDVDANWSKDPNWTISNGKATSTGNGRMYQSIPELEGNIGTEVTVSFEITERTSGGVVVTCYGVSSGLITEVGTHSFSGTTSDSLNLYINNSGSGNLVGSIDNISVKKIIDGDFTFTRSTQATRVNSQGLIEKERGNLILKSNNLYQSPWTKTDSTVTGGQTGYDGSSDAWLLNSSTTGSPRVEQNVTSTGINTFSIYAKSATDTFIQMRTFGADSEVWFNLATGGIVSSSGAGYITSKAENIGSGWYRCSVTVNGSLSNVRAYPGSAFGVYSTSGNGIYIQDIQLEQGLVATDYIETTTAAVYTGITDNVPRLDYDGDCPSLLLEPQRTNLITKSEYITGQNVTITYNDITSPEGVVNAAKFVETTALNSHNVLQSSVISTNASAVTYTMSVFAKKKEREFIQLQFFADSTSTFSSAFDLSNGTTDGSSSTHKIEDYGNGWYRCSFTASITNSTGGYNFARANIGQSSSSFYYTGDGVSGLYYYGFQLEEGSYATSYIPTYGTSVTRNNDQCSAADVSSLIGQNEGSYYIEWTHRIADQTYSMFNISDGTNNNRVQLTLNPAQASRLGFIYVVDGSVHFQDTNIQSLTVGQNYKLAVTYTQTSLIIYLDGTEVVNYTSFSASNGSFNQVAFALKDENISFVFGMPSSKVLVFDTPLSNQELADLTT